MKMLYLPNTKTGVMVTDRELALTNAIRVVFPGTTCLLCAFHVENNVKSHAAEAFGKDKSEDIMAFVAAWKAVIYSPTLVKYDDNWNALQNTYDTRIRAVVQYLKETCLDAWKYSLVHTYVNRHLHLGTKTMSKVEGAHATLKKYLQVSTGNLKLVFDKISLLLTSQHAKYNADIARNKTITPHTARHPLYSQLLGRISNYALNQL
jgi:transposase-like protein